MCNSTRTEFRGAGWRNRSAIAVLVVFSVIAAFPESQAQAADCNGNGIDDALDITSGTSLDCNANAIPDECGPPGDFNGNAVVELVDSPGFHACTTVSCAFCLTPLGAQFFEVIAGLSASSRARL